MTAARAHEVLHEAGEAADTITLDAAARHKRRVAMTSDNGIEFLLDLPQARLLRHGDGLLLDDGRVIQVAARPEPVYEVYGSGHKHLARLAWQLGNRHLPTQVLADRLRIRPDHVIKAMLEGLGARVVETESVFDPESGAYDRHRHDHD